MKVAIQFDPRFAGMSIWLWGENKKGRYHILPVNLTVQQLSPDEQGIAPEPTFRLTEPEGTEFLNSLVNALVEAGFKPNEVKAHDKEVSAIRYHLEDMRKLVFK